MRSAVESTSRDEWVLVGEGRTAEILAWDARRVLRLFREGASRAYAARELHVSESVHAVGIPSPAVYRAQTEDGVIDLDGRVGILMERIEGPTMLRALIERPWKLWRFARELADLHRSVHARQASGLPLQRERLHYVIDRIAARVGEDAAARIHRAVDRLPDGDRICHGDFHPGNVLMASRGPAIIDWGPATSGSPAADVAWTVYLFRHGGTPPGTGLLGRLLLATLRRLFLHVYLTSYLSHSVLTGEEIKKWSGPIAALRLGDEIPEERDALLGILRKYYG